MTQRTKHPLFRLGLLLACLSFSACYGIVGTPPSGNGKQGTNKQNPNNNNQAPDASTTTPQDSGNPTGQEKVSHTMPDGQVSSPDVQVPLPDAQVAPPALCNVPAPSQLRRLTRTEYKHSLADLLGVTIDVDKIFPPDENTFGFAVGTGVSFLRSQLYMKTAEQITTGLKLDTILPCKVAEGDDACAKNFIRDFGQKAYRRPLTSQEQDRVFQAYKTIKTQFDFATGIRIAIQLFLQSPHFLYRIQKGSAADGQGRALLAPYELASRLAYFLWSSPPDETLLKAAAENKLSTPAQLEAQARRMLADPKAKRTIDNFFSQWLELENLENLDKNKDVYPSFNPELAHDMRTEILSLIHHIIWEKDASFKTLMTAPYTFLNERLAKHYSIPNVTGAQFRLVQLDPKKRVGLINLGGLMAIHAKRDQSSPIHRGLFIRKFFLCHIPPPPPDDIVVEPPKVDPNVSTRKRFEQHRKDLRCSGCHQLLDPIGFGFEHFDAIGRFREKDGNVDVDASGHLYATDDVDGAFYGGAQLAQKLSGSTQVHDCFVRQWFRYTFGREETANDACFLQEINQRFKQANYNIQELLIAIVKHKMFIYLKGDLQEQKTGSNASPLTAAPSAPGAPTKPPSAQSCSSTPLPGQGGFGLLLFLSFVFAFLSFQTRRTP